MVLVASIEPARSVLGAPPADLLLKIVGTARDGQVIRLTNRKCSVGSAANCTLRLRARGVRPVHCLLLRGPGGTVLRSWAPGTRVNGEIVSDAVLEPGDLITIGPVEFEVLPSEGPPVDPTDAGRTVVLDRRPANRQLSAASLRPSGSPQFPTSPAAAPRGESLETALAPRPWHARARRLVGEVRKLRDQINRLEQAGPVAAQHAAEASQLRQQLDSVQDQHRAWQSTLERLQSELDARQTQLAEESAALEHRRTELDADRRSWQTERHAQQQTIAEREAVLTAATDLLHKQRLEIEQHATSNEHLAARQTELDRLAAELDARRVELETRETELAAAEAAVHMAEEELAGLRASLESQRVAASDELAAAHQDLLATQTEFAAARERIEAENRLLAAGRDELASHGSRLADFEAELVAAREALAALHDSQQQRLGQRTAELDRLTAELADRELELAQRLAASQASTDTVVSEPDADYQAELQSLRQELAARQSQQQLEAERMARESAHAELLAQHQQTQYRLEQAEQQLQLRAEELAQLQTALTVQQLERETPPSPGAAELADLATQRESLLAAEAELQREREQLDAEREALRVQRESFAQERLRAADRLDADARELAEAREQLDAEREELESRLSRPPSRWSTPNDDDRDEVSDDSAAFSEFSPDRRASRPAVPPDVETERPLASETLRSRPAADEDESIESHIAAFMDRLRSGQPVAPPVIERTLPKRRKSDEPAATPPVQQADPVPETPSPQVLDMSTAPMDVARRKAPEEKSSMNVLREIGLSHARSAIDTHGQRRSLNQAYTTLAISGACLAVAFFVLYLAQSAVMQSAGIVILVIGIYWMGSSIWAANKVVATIRRRRKGGLRAMLDEVDAEIAAIRKEAEAELAATEIQQPGETAVAD